MQHQNWCAKTIAYNAQVTFVVKCDCRKNPAAVVLGTLGGKSTSEAKKAAARTNGAKNKKKTI